MGTACLWYAMSLVPPKPHFSSSCLPSATNSLQIFEVHLWNSPTSVQLFHHVTSNASDSASSGVYQRDYYFFACVCPPLDLNVAVRICSCKLCNLSSHAHSAIDQLLLLSICARCQSMHPAPLLFLREKPFLCPRTTRSANRTSIISRCLQFLPFLGCGTRPSAPPLLSSGCALDLPLVFEKLDCSGTLSLHEDEEHHPHFHPNAHLAAGVTGDGTWFAPSASAVLDSPPCFWLIFFLSLPLQRSTRTTLASLVLLL